MNTPILTRKASKNTDGFTIIELLIATAVFSTVLLLSLTGFLQIGQMFYKGINATQTSSTARGVSDSLKRDIIYDAGTSVIPAPANNTLFSGVTRSYFCVGTNRYTYILFQELDASQEAAEMSGSQPVNSNPLVLQWHNFGLLKDTVLAGCPDPFPPSITASTVQMGKISNPLELLSDKSRVTILSVSPLAIPGTKLYNLDVRIAYGDDVVMTNITDPYMQCVGSAAATQFCFTTELKTVVRRGF